MNAINFGCGIRHTTFEGFDKTLNIDIRPDVKPDVLAEAFSLPVVKGEVGLMFTSHVFEHFGPQDNRKLLRYWHSLMPKGGKLWIIIPNLEFACVQILRDGEPDSNSMDILYGHQEYKENFHKNGFTKKSLRKFVDILGLYKIISCENISNGFEIELKAETI